MDTGEKRINLAGCRVRPFMENAFKHGYRVAAVDGFNDWDALRFGTLAGNASAPMGDFAQVLEEYKLLPLGPVLFCGPVEYDPGILERAREGREVINPSTHAIAKCRTIPFWREMATDGIVMPETSISKGECGRDWIAKDIKSAGGTGIAFPSEEDECPSGNGRYYQQLVKGEPLGAVFFSSSGGGARLMGITRHITGDRNFLQKPFMFGGMIYPAEIGGVNKDFIKLFGERVAESTGLRGWWGADFIINERGVFLLEINPRPTASLELVSIALDLDIVGMQTAAVKGIEYAHRPDPKAGEQSFLATAVLYAEEDMLVTNQVKWFGMWARDIPREGRTVKKGDPVISFYSRATSAGECMLELNEKARLFYEAC